MMPKLPLSTEMLNLFLFQIAIYQEPIDRGTEGILSNFFDKKIRQGGMGGTPLTVKFSNVDKMRKGLVSKPNSTSQVV